MFFCSMGVCILELILMKLVELQYDVGKLIKGQEEMKVALAASTTIPVDTDIKMIQEKLPCSSNMALIALNDLGEEERLSLVSKIK